METIHSFLSLYFIFLVFSSLSLASSLVSQGHAEWGHTRCVDWDQPNWNSDPAWMAKRDAGQLRLYKIVILMHKLLDVGIFESGQNTEQPCRTLKVDNLPLELSLFVAYLQLPSFHVFCLKWVSTTQQRCPSPCRLRHSRTTPWHHKVSNA